MLLPRPQRSRRLRMTASRIDPELLAALLDGRARPTEREALLRLIASSREAYDEFSEAAAIWRGLHSEVDWPETFDEHEPSVPRESQQAPASVVMLTSSDVSVAPRIGLNEATGGRQFRRRAFMLAAAVLAIVLVLRLRHTSPDVSVLEVARAAHVAGASGSGSLARTLGPRWDTPEWTVTRGSSAQRSATAQAFRLGVRFAQFELAANAHDTVAVRTAAENLQPELRDIEGAGPVIEQVQSIAQQHERASAGVREMLGANLRDVAGETSFFDLGVWVSAAQVAARGGDSRFFEKNGAGMRTLITILGNLLGATSAPASNALGGLRELARRGVTARDELTLVQATLSAVARTAGSD